MRDYYLIKYKIMGLKKFFLRKGIVGTISRDVLNKYMFIINKSEYHDEEIYDYVWRSWLEKNSAFIKEQDGIDKNVRLDITIERWEKDYKNKSLIDVFDKVLYIEAEILSISKDYFDCISIFVEEAQKYNIGLSKKLENYSFFKNKLKL